MALALLAVLYLLLAAALAVLAAWLEGGETALPEALRDAAPRAAFRGWRRGGILRLSWPAALVLTLLPLAYTGAGFLPGTTLAPTPLLAGVPPWADADLAASMRAEAAANPLLLDPLSQFLPWREAARRDLLFNPSQGGGAALLANGQSAVLFPTEVMARWLPPFRAATFSQAARLLLAGWGAFLLAGAVLRGRPGGAATARPALVRAAPGARPWVASFAALVAAVVWVGCGFLQVWRLHPHTLVAAMAPWVLYALLRLARRPGSRTAVGLAVAGALSVAGGHPETLLHVLLFGLLAVAAIWWAERRPQLAARPEEPPAGRRLEGRGPAGSPASPLRLLAWGFAAALLAALLAAPLLLPFVENLRVSSEWVLRRDTGTVVEVGLEEALERLRPAFALYTHGDPLAGTWDGPENLAELAGGSVGAAALLLALLAVLLPGGRRRGLAVALLLLGLVGLLVSVHLPGISRPFGEVPLLRESLLKRLSIWWSLAVTLLAALGAQAWWQRLAVGRGRGGGAARDEEGAGDGGEDGAEVAAAVPAKAKDSRPVRRPATGGARRILPLPAAVLAVAALVVAALLAWAGASPSPDGSLPGWVAWEWGSLALALLLLALLAISPPVDRRGDGPSWPAVRRPRRATHPSRLHPPLYAPLLAAALLLVLLLPRIDLFAGWIPAVGPAGFYPETLATRHVARALSEVEGRGFRVVGLDAALVPHSAAFFGFPEVRAYDPMTYAPYAELLSLAEGPPRRPGEAPPLPAATGLPASELAAGRRHGWHKLVDPTSPILDFLGARFIFDHPSMGRRRGLEPIHLDDGALVYENPDALPRAFVPQRVVVFATAEEAVAAAGQVEDFALEVTLTGIDVGYQPVGDPGRRLPSGPARVVELAVEPGRLTAVVEAQAPALLATSQPAIPGWRVRQDGAATERFLVNGAFLGVVVEEGRHRVEMVYAPASWQWGLGLFAVGLVLAVAMAAVGRWRPAGGDGDTMEPS